MRRKELKILRVGQSMVDQNWTNITQSFYTLRATTMQIGLHWPSQKEFHSLGLQEGRWRVFRAICLLLLSAGWIPRQIAPLTKWCNQGTAFKWKKPKALIKVWDCRKITLLTPEKGNSLSKHCFPQSCCTIYTPDKPLDSPFMEGTRNMDNYSRQFS